MPATVSNSAKALLRGNVFRYVRLWKLTRRDGVVMRFADHPEPIVWEGQVYTPADFEPSASEHRAGFAENNVEIRGGISSQAITYQDLRAGLYNDARVEEITVDWKYPFSETVGHFRRDVFIVDGVQYSGEVFQGDILSLPGVLSRRAGRTINRDCDAEVGDSRCGLDLELYRVAGEITAVSEDRRVIETDLSDPDGRYDDGVVTMTSGPNSGFNLFVKKYLNADGEIQLQLRAPFSISVGETFTIVPGCGRTRADCKGTTGTKNRPWPTNIENFRGFPDMPGSTTILKTPNS